jgi:hypothetical protein
MPSSPDASFVAIGVGGAVIMGYMRPSPANADTESKRVKMTAAKNCCSFFMVFPAKVKLLHNLDRVIGQGFCTYSNLLVEYAIK